MKILFDTNIILDVLLNRQPFVEMSSRLVSSVENQELEGCLSATTITTIDYLISKVTSREKSKLEIHKLLKLFQISAVNSSVIELAINSNFKDFEDAVQYFSGECDQVNGLVTRNIKDYKCAGLPIYTPEELLGLLSIMKNDPK